MDILIIDDDRTTRDSLGMLLKFEGHRVWDCESGIAALDMMKEQRFDVFLVDYRMPGMAGDEVVRLARTLSPDAYIIGFSVENKDHRFLAAGADAFIAKNLLVRELIPLLENRIEH
jgi:CheY-like chemotaxis protein